MKGDNIVIFEKIENLPELILINGVPQCLYKGKGGWHGHRLPLHCDYCKGEHYVRRGAYGTGGSMWTCTGCLALFVVAH